MTVTLASSLHREQGYDQPILVSCALQRWSVILVQVAKQSALGKAFVAKNVFLVVWSGGITRTSTVTSK